jgi:hypothetical protein
VDKAARVVSVVPGPSTTARSSGLPFLHSPAHPLAMGTKSRETIYGASIRAAAERATEARKEADRLAVAAWNKRMLGFQGPAQPSPTLGDAINAGFPDYPARLSSFGGPDAWARTPSRSAMATS